MISITRTETPNVLVNSDSSRDRYNLQEVVDALHSMQFGKCCYCEVKIPGSGHSKHVEHFKPKATYPRLKNVWSNLLLSCPQCNGYKSNNFPTDNGVHILLDPSNSTDHPESHIEFKVNPQMNDCGIIHPKNNSRRGRVTIEIIGLEKQYYYNRRRSFIEDVLMPDFLLLLRGVRNVDDTVISRQIRQFECYMSSNNEFAGLAREFIRKIDWPPGVEFNVPTTEL